MKRCAFLLVAFGLLAAGCGNVQNDAVDAEPASGDMPGSSTGAVALSVPR